MKSQQSNPTPNWKHVILATHDWPDDLVVPQNDPLPEQSEAIQDSMSTKENWEWELWRHPDGHSYYLKLWAMDEGDFGNPKIPLRGGCRTRRMCRPIRLRRAFSRAGAGPH